MDNPQEINSLNDLKWLGGFFDGEGYCSFASEYPVIGLVNTNPIAVAKCKMIFQENNIEIKVCERSKPSKSSKKKRWDLYICNKVELMKAVHLLKNFVHGKSKQLDLILEYENCQDVDKEYFYRKMRYLNQTNNILIVNDDILREKLGFDFQKEHLNADEEFRTIQIDESFNDLYYLAGIIDGEGTIEISQRANKYRTSDKFIPVMSFTNTNKVIIEKCCSTIRNNDVGCYISNRTREDRNRLRWDVQVIGCKRTVKLSELLKTKLIIKRQHAELLNLYCNGRLKSPKTVNDTGYDYKMAIQTLTRNC